MIQGEEMEGDEGGGRGGVAKVRKWKGMGWGVAKVRKWKGWGGG